MRRAIARAVLVAGVALAGRVDAFTVRVDPAAGISLESGGHVLVADAMPAVRLARFESRVIDDGQIRYTFEEADVSGGQVTASPDGAGLDLVHAWGTVRIVPAARDGGVDLVITIENRSARTLADFELALLEVDFPAPPEGDTRPVSNRDRPATVRMAWGEGGDAGLLYAGILTHEPLQLGFGRAPRGMAARRPLTVSGNVRTFAPGAVEMFPYGLPRVGPGESMTFRVGLRRVPAGTPVHEALPALHAEFAARFPSVVNWHDRRPIGAIFLPSRGRISETNPRGWFNDPRVDITTPEGLAALEKRFLDSARMAVGVLTGIGAQGMIVWNLEGEENPHPISYIGDPRLMATLAPELDGFIDAYFRLFREAGIRTGVTLRPTQPYQRDDGSWHHGTGSHMTGRNPHDESFDDLLPEGLQGWRFFPIVERLSRKIAYAQDRWGASIFYVDTNGIHVPVGDDFKFEWMLLDHWVWRELRARHPDVLIIPEFARGPACFATVAPYDQLDYTKRTTTPAHVRALYPESFIANYVVNSSRDLLAKGEPWFEALVDATERGDTVIHRGWFNCAVNNDIRAVFAAAARRAPFEVFIAPDGLTLNGDAVAGPAALVQALRAATPDAARVAQRRVYVGFDPAVDRETAIEPVLAAITEARAFIAWTQPLPRTELAD